MKSVLINLFAALVLSANAQQPAILNFKTPTPSPEASVIQQFGNSQIFLSYGRPLVRGRKIFGELVPFDSLWRTGAGDCTTLEFKEDVIVGDKKIPPGKYSLFTIPSEKEWTIILNSDATLHGAFGYDAQKDVYRFKVKFIKTERFYETFTLEINDFTARGDASLNLIWENTLVRIPLKSPADEAIMAEIQKRVIENKEQNANLLYQAASYYHTTGRDLKQAGQWIGAAEKLDGENFNYPNLAQKILADLKDYKPAIEAAKRAVALGEKGNMTNSVANLKKRIADWESLTDKQ